MHSLEASFLSLTAVHCPWTTLGLSRSEKTVLCNFSWTRPPSGREETWGGGYLCSGKRRKGPLSGAVLGMLSRKNGKGWI